MNSCKRNWLPDSFIILPGLSLYLPWHSPQWQPSHAVFNMFLLHYIRTGLSRLNIDKTQKTHESSSSRFTGGEDVSAGSRLEKKKEEEKKLSLPFIHSFQVLWLWKTTTCHLKKKSEQNLKWKAEKRVHTCGNNTTSPHEKDRGSFTLSCSKRKCFVTRKKRKKKTETTSEWTQTAPAKRAQLFFLNNVPRQARTTMTRREASPSWILHFNTYRNGAAATPHLCSHDEAENISLGVCSRVCVCKTTATQQLKVYPKM